MNRNDDHLQSDGAPQKLEWVTPKISLMDAGDTESKTPHPNKTIKKYKKSQTPPQHLNFLSSVVWSLLTDFTSNPATPTKTSHRKGSA